MIVGFERAVMDMKQGEKKHATLPPHQGYGERNESAMQNVPRAAFRPDFEFEIGGVIQGNGPQGAFIATIKSVDDEAVVLDMNHPLAGETLHFDIEVLSIEDTLAESDDTPIMADWSKSMKKAELLEVARTRGLGVNTKSTKAQIIEALQT